MPTVTYTVLDGEIVSENRDGVERDYVPDPLGSTVALLDSNQAKTDTFQYWPYGEERSRTGTTPTPIRYGGARGYYRDSPARTYVRARYLQVLRARWLTADPIGIAWGTSRYRYVANRPTYATDASGLRECYIHEELECEMRCRSRRMNLLSCTVDDQWPWQPHCHCWYWLDPSRGRRHEVELPQPVRPPTEEPIGGPEEPPLPIPESPLYQGHPSFLPHPQFPFPVSQFPLPEPPVRLPAVPCRWPRLLPVLLPGFASVCFVWFCPPASPLWCILHPDDPRCRGEML
jgi:RHS repeat-associated protein